MHPTIRSMVFQGQDVWRKHPIFQHLWKSPFPGLKQAVIVYSAYVVAEYGYKLIKLTTKPSKDKGWYQV